VSVYYDPLIAKLCTWGRTREAAIARMRRALDEYYIRGVSHNIPFLASVMGSERFGKGQLTTNFIAEEYPNGFVRNQVRNHDQVVFIAVAAAIHSSLNERDRQVALNISAGTHDLNWVVVLGSEQRHVRLHRTEDAEFRVSYVVHFEGKSYTVCSNWQPGQFVFRGKINEDRICVQVDRDGIGYRLFHGGAEVNVKVLSKRAAELYALMPAKTPPDTSKFLLSPMPGVLVSLAVQEGQEVKAGDALAVVEAMKVENILRADRDGMVLKLHAAARTSLSVDQKILEFA
jgi:propionyl-CoA carboxylase alpha chain